MVPSLRRDYTTAVNDAIRRTHTHFLGILQKSGIDQFSVVRGSPRPSDEMR